MTLHDTHDTIRSPHESLDLYRERTRNLGARGLLVRELDHEIPSVSVNGYDHRLIGPGSPINGGIYIDTGGKTAIVVDWHNDKIFEQTLKQFTPAFERICHSKTRQEGLTGLTSTIARILPYDNDTVIDLYRADYGDTRPLVSHSLGEFIKAGAGICVQQALLTSASIEYAVATGILPPDNCSVSFESGYDELTGERHAYTLFKVDNDLWRLDPTKQRHERAIRSDNKR